MKLTFPNVLCCFFWLLCSQCLPESQLKKAEPWKIAQVFKKCIVEDWVFCTATCPPEEGTIDSMIEGNYGMHIGEFITPALETYSAASLSSCCKKCTNYNNLHHRDIFGYICDYWSWDAKTGVKWLMLLRLTTK